MREGRVERPRLLGVRWTARAGVARGAWRRPGRPQSEGTPGTSPAWEALARRPLGGRETWEGPGRPGRGGGCGGPGVRVGGDSRRRRVGPGGEKEGPRGGGGDGAGRGRAACPGSRTRPPPAQRAETAGPRRPDPDERRARGPRQGAGGSAGLRGPPGLRRSGAERSWDTGGAAAAPDGTSALGPLVPAGASGEAFSGRFTPAFLPLGPRPRFAPRRPWSQSFRRASPLPPYPPGPPFRSSLPS